MKDTMNRTPSVSVIIPAFNVAPFIVAAVRSALDQTISDLELTVVDDGSTDGTVDELRQIADPRLRILRQQHAGSSAARNLGIEATQAGYVAFLDGDDMWLPHKLAVHLQTMEMLPKLDMTFSRSSIIDEQGASTGRRSRRVTGPVSFRDLVKENVVANGSSVVIRRSALEETGGFDVSLRAAVDLDLWLRVALLRSGNILAIPEVLTLYRMRSGQVTKDWRRMEESWLRVLDKMRTQAAAEVAFVESAARSRWLRYLSYIAYESAQYRDAESLLTRAVAASPREVATDKRAWLLAGALAARRTLSPSVHLAIDRMVRRCRAWLRSSQTDFQKTVGSTSNG